MFETKAYEEAQTRLKINQEKGYAPTPTATEQPALSELTDEQRIDVLRQAEEQGVPLSNVKADKFGADPASFAIEHTFNKAKQLGLTNEQYKSTIDDYLVKNGYDLSKFRQDGSQFVNDRFQVGLANTLMEMYIGGKEIVGLEVTDTESKMNELLFQEKKQREAYYKYAESTMDEGKLDSNTDLAGGLGEMAPAVVMGLGVGTLAKSGYALVADLAAQQAISTMEFKGASELDESAGLQYGIETGANIVGYGIGKGINKLLAKSTTSNLDEATEKAVNTMGQDHAFSILTAIDFAKKNGVNILGHDVDPGTQLSQLVEAAKSNPVLSASLKKTTEKDVEAITAYISKVKNEYSDLMADDTSMGQYINRVINAQEVEYDSAISKAYDDMGNIMGAESADMSNKTFIGWLDGIKSNVSKQKGIEPSDRKHLLSYVDEYVKDYQVSGNNVNVQDMYDMMRKTISRVAELNKKGDGGPEARAYAQLADLFEGQFDTLAKGHSSQGGPLAEVMNNAKGLYRKRVELFGYRGTGKGGSGTGFISSFRDKYAKDPEGAMKLVNTPEKLRELKDISGDGGDIVDMLKRNFLQRAVSKSTDGVQTNLSGFSKELMKDEAFSRELFGADFDSMKNLSTVADIVGKRVKSLSKTSTLITNALANNFFTSPLAAIDTVWKLAKGRVAGWRLKKADQVALNGIIKEMEDTLGMSIEEFKASLKGSQLLPATVSVGKTADELYISPTGVPTEAEAKVVQGELVERQTVANLEEQATKAQQLELQGVDKQLNRQQTNLNKEVNTLFKTRQVAPDDKLEFNRIQEQLVTARNQGDREAVQEGMSSLETFNRYIKSQPKKETTPERASRQKIEEAVAREARVEQARIARIRRVKEAEVRAERIEAERLVREQANRENAERLARARQEERTAREASEAEARATRPTRPASRDEARATAERNMVDNLNSRHMEGWTVTGNGSHLRFINSSPEATFQKMEYGVMVDKQPNFSLSIHGDEIGACTVGLPNGGGVGEKVYHSLFDMAEELGGVYTPDSQLLTANPVRTGMNMISYMGKRGEDATHIRFSHSQKALGRRGDSNYLGGKRLTLENANQLADNMKRMVNRKLPSGINLSSRTSDEAIAKMASTTGGDPNTRIGPKSLKLLREFLRSGRDLSAMGAVLGLIVMDDELMNLLERKDK